MKRRATSSGDKSKGKGGCLSVLVGMAGVFGLGFLALMLAPASWLPWTPLSIEDRPNGMTRWKLAGFAHDPEACRAFLTSAGVTFRETADTRERDYCLVGDAIIMTDGGPPLSPANPMMTCPVAAGLLIWKRHGLDPLAQRVVGAPITKITHIGTYNCRRQRGNGSSMPSEHATANAIDIAGFTFADGSSIALPGGWAGMDGASRKSAEFLEQAQIEACKVYKVVLGPRANAAHADHFHLDMGLFSSCR